MASINSSSSSLPLFHPNQTHLPSLEDLLGPRRQDLVKVIPVTVIYVIIFVTGVVGNVSTCVVIARNRYMHTATNVCLFNLAVSDLLMVLLGLPQETYSFWSAYPWVLGETFCVFRTMAAETSTYSSILTITAFTVERYVAICHPVKARVLSGLGRAAKVIALIWVVSATCSIPIVVQYQVVYVPDDNGVPIPDSATCNIPNDRYLSQAFEISTFLFFVAPITVISVLYGLIGLAIRRSALTRTGSDASGHGDKTAAAAAAVDHRYNQQARTRLSVIKMLVAVVVAFFLCWAPFHTQRLLIVYADRTQPSLFNAVLFYVSGVLYYVSAVINPILYNIMSLKFRRAFRNTLCRSVCVESGRKELVCRRTRVTGYRFQGRQLVPDAGGGGAGALEGGGGAKRDSSEGGHVPQARCPAAVVHDPLEQDSGRGGRGTKREFDEEEWAVCCEHGANADRAIIERHSGTSPYAFRHRLDKTGWIWIENQPHRTPKFLDKDRTTV